jgi:protein-disulfide isomerase-like protein with CxxC motif
MLRSKLKAQEIETEILELDDNMDLVEEYKIRSVPTLLVIEDDGTYYTATGSDDIIEELKRKDV